MNRFMALVLAALSTSYASLAVAEPWGETRGWTILIDTGAGPACLMHKTFEDGLVVELGFVKEPSGAFFAAYHPDWEDADPNKTGLVEFHFDTVGFGGEVVNRSKGGLSGGYAFFNNPEFLSEFAGREAVKVIGPEGESFEVSLKGTSLAIKAVRECQAEQDD